MSDFVFTPIERERETAGGWRFRPLDEGGDGDGYRFTPLEGESGKPSMLKTIAIENPATAIGETALNLATQGVALPVAGLFGLYEAAGSALGLHDRDPSGVVQHIGDALTYQPRGEFGKAATAAVMIPFEKLHEGAQYAGGRTLEATGSPGAATAAHTFIEGVLPLAVGPAAKAGKAAIAKAREAAPATETPKAPAAEAASEYRFTPIDEVADAQRIGEAAGRVVADPPAMQQPTTGRLDVLRRPGNQDGARVGAELPAVPDGRWHATEPGSLARPIGRDQELRAGQRGMDDAAPADAPASILPEGAIERSAGDYRGSLEGIGDRGLQAAAADAGLRQDVARSGDARQVGAAGRDIADASGRDAAAGAVGEARRPSSASRVEAPENRMAAREGVEQGTIQGPKTARWALIEADDLRASHDVDMRPVAGNPFGRQGAIRAEHETAVQGIVKDFEPRRLVEAVDDAAGAPIVARDGVVEAGQRRAIAVQRIYQANGLKAEAYRHHIREQAPRLGIDAAAVDNLRKPVLVRLPDEPAPRAAGREPSPVRAQVGEPSDAQAMAAGVQNGTWNPGANYSPFVDQVRAPTSGSKTVADLPAPKRREHIIKRFAGAIGTTVYEGRVKGKNRLGFFRKGVEEVRTKRANDLEVTAHEVAHLIDARVPEISSAWRSDKALREELKSVSYDQKSVSEGFAEGVRLFLTQPETLEARAPKVHAWLSDFAERHQYGPALRQAQADMTTWFGQDALNRARSKIGTEKPLAEFFDRFWDKFRQSTADDLHGVYRMEQDLTGKINAVGPYESARLSRASASIADGAVRFGHPVKLPDGSFKFAGKGLEDILKPVSKNIEDTLLYFVGRSAGELMQQGREHLFTKGEIDAMLRLRTAERDKAFAEYQAWNKGILDFAEAQGIINPESRRLWQRTQYLPFHRVEQPGGIKGKPGDWSGVQALTGGTTNIKDVLGNMVGNAAMLIDKAVKNEARRKIANLSQKDGGGRFMVKIEPGERPVRISGDQVLTEMFKRYGIGIDGDALAFFEFMLKGQPPAGSNVVAVLQGGKPVWFEVGDPILYRALQAIDRPVQSEVVRWLGLPKRIGQATITATPDFWMANIARDTLMGSVMSRAGFRPVLDSLQGMRLRMTSDPVYRDYLANGGGLSSIFLDEQKLRTKLERFYRDQGIDYRTVLDAPDKLLTFMETLGDAFEMSTRLGEYRRAIQAGEHPRHAAYMGRDVSTDFAMRGDSKALGFLYDTVMFLRPAVVSWDRLYRGLAHDPNKGAIAAKAGTMALASAALYLLNRDDPRYADLPDWDRDANWHFFVGGQHFRWPKIWEIGAMSSAAERSVEKIMAEDPAGLGKDFARILGHTFSVNWMPQIIAPLAEQATNRNNFTKAPLETPGMESVQPFLRAKPGTSETMKAAGMATRELPEALQINPVRAEALLRGYFNTYALYGLMLSDQALFGDKLPEKRADELPVVRRFYANEPAKHTRYESEFYALLQESKRLRGTMRELDDLGYRSYADDKEASPLAGEAKPLERAAKSLSGINNETQAVRRNDALSPAEKRQRLDALTVERNALLKDAVTESKKAQGAKAMTPADVVGRGLPK